VSGRSRVAYPAARISAFIEGQSLVPLGTRDCPYEGLSP